MKIPAFEKRLRTGELVELRSPDAADAPAVLAYLRALAKDAWRNLNHPPETYEAITVVAEEAFLETCARDPRAFFVAAFHDGKVIGATNLHMETSSFAPHTAELGLGVLDAYRQKGVGRLLLETLIANADRNGVWNLLLRVRTFNAPAIALYESLGFRRVGTLHHVVELPGSSPPFADEHLYQREGNRGGRG